MSEEEIIQPRFVVGEFGPFKYDQRVMTPIYRLASTLWYKGRCYQKGHWITSILKDKMVEDGQEVPWDQRL